MPDDMRIRRRKSRTSQAADLLGSCLKPKAASKAAKGARKAAKGTAAYQVARRTPFIRRVPLIAVPYASGLADWMMRNAPPCGSATMAQRPWGSRPEPG